MTHYWEGSKIPELAKALWESVLEEHSEYMVRKPEWKLDMEVAQELCRMDRRDPFTVCLGNWGFNEIAQTPFGATSTFVHPFRPLWWSYVEMMRRQQFDADRIRTAERKLLEKKASKE